MNCWAVLGIEATQDKKSIKRAYAKLLKQIDVSQEPDKFQQLREAYDYALYYAESGAADLRATPDMAASDADERRADILRQTTVEAPELSYTTVTSDNLHTASAQPSPMSPAQEAEPEFDPYREAHFIMERVAAVFDDPQARKDTAQWRAALSVDAIEDFEVRDIVRYDMFAFVVSKLDVGDWNAISKKPITRDVIQYLNHVFHWTDSELELSQHFEPQEINMVMYEIHGFKGLALDRQSDVEKPPRPIWMQVLGWLVVISCFTSIFSMFTK
ncbi:protein containing DnaJ domain [Hahella chejuensis KCTC 2396]|uniref:Protein containing DnaJ domain n=1 Tax=Hahella chejuensis (strain KCTC 2396) TaxID=349521 RepID=Q2SAX0_HAHCH|nr:molecular chaperone DnaJ [Hahella chejuensis]ABC32204.1 protein containing DnaJ domain [Hahella chejuensis KCTC 2396]